MNLWIVLHESLWSVHPEAKSQFISAIWSSEQQEFSKFLTCLFFIFFPSSLSLLHVRPRWERSSGALRPRLEGDRASPRHAPRERGESDAELQDQEAAVGRKGAAEPTVCDRTRHTGDQWGERQSQGYYFKLASVLPPGCWNRQGVNVVDGEDFVINKTGEKKVREDVNQSVRGRFFIHTRQVSAILLNTFFFHPQMQFSKNTLFSNSGRLFPKIYFFILSVHKQRSNFNFTTNNRQPCLLMMECTVSFEIMTRICPFFFFLWVEGVSERSFTLTHPFTLVLLFISLAN